MPKLKQSTASRLKYLAEQYGEEGVQKDGDRLKCSCCGIIIGIGRCKRFLINQHLNTAKHAKNKKKKKILKRRGVFKKNDKAKVSTEILKVVTINSQKTNQTSLFKNKDIENVSIDIIKHEVSDDSQRINLASSPEEMDGARISTNMIRQAQSTEIESDVSKIQVHKNESFDEEYNEITIMLDEDGFESLSEPETPRNLNKNSKEKTVAEDSSPQKLYTEKFMKMCEEFKDETIIWDGDRYLCQSCGIHISKRRSFLVKQHIKTSKHKKNKPLKINRQSLNISNAVEFNTELCKAFLSADIPLHKLTNNVFANFLKKYTGRIVPEESTIRKNYVPQSYNHTLTLIREHIQNGPIWVSLGVIRDVSERNVANIVVRKMCFDEPGRPYLLNSAQMQENTALAIAEVFNESMNILWPNNVQYERVFVFVTTDDEIMREVALHLQISYPRLTHVTCMVDGLNQLTDAIRQSFPLVEELMVAVEKTFTKAPDYVKKFKQLQPNLDLPPKSNLKKSSFLIASEYYADNFTEIRNVFENIKAETTHIIRAKAIFQDPAIIRQLCMLKKYYVFIAKDIVNLETHDKELSNSLQIVKHVVDRLTETSDGSIKEKMAFILDNNRGLKALAALENDDPNLISDFEQFADLSPADLVSFKYAPIVSVDIEKTFTVYRNILLFNRRSFNFDNLKMHLIICCYSK